MIVIVTGQSGNGKSSWMVMEIKRLIELGRPVFTIGIPKLKLPVIEWKRSQLRHWHEIEPPPGYTYEQTLEELEREGAIYDQDGNEIPCPLKHLPDGAAVFVDEGQKSWAPTGSKFTPDQLALSMHRHWGLDFYVASQSPRFLHQSLTENASQHIHIHKTWRGSELLQFGECQANPTAVSIRETAFSKKYKPDPASFDLYESASVHTKIKYGIPKKAIFAGVAFLALPFGLYAIYNVIYSKYKKPAADPVPASAPVSPVAPGSTQRTVIASHQTFSNEWFIKGHSRVGQNVLVILQSPTGLIKYVYNPPAFRVQGSQATLLLDGQLIFNTPLMVSAAPAPASSPGVFK